MYNSGTALASGMDDLSLSVMMLSLGKITRPVPESREWVSLMSRARDNAGAGGAERALSEVMTALDSVFDDSPLFGIEWEPLGSPEPEARSLDAIALTYACSYGDAYDLFADSYCTTFNELYVMARCMEKLECWNAVARLYDRMSRIYYRDSQNESTKYNKFLYRLAMLKEYHFGMSGKDIMRNLFINNTEKVSLLIELRKMLLQDDMLDSVDNEAVMRFLDAKSSNEDFATYAKRVKREKPYVWEGLLSFLRGIHLCCENRLLVQ